MIDLNKINKIHFIGIGGIGISAAAGILHCRGFVVSGSDARASEIIDDLRQGGIAVQVSHDAKNISANLDLAVYSVAVPENNPERAKARELNIPEMSYPQLLGELMKGKYGLGVSGTDGKTTTTAIIAKIMIDAGQDPTVILGSRAEFLEGNWRCGGNDYFVFEADEYRRAFDNYDPRIAVITNIGVDHLDYYENEDDYLSAFKAYLNKMPADGFVIINNDDSRSIEAAKDCPAKRVTYGLEKAADYGASGIIIADGRQEFFVLENGAAAAALTLSLPGRYNISNALAAIAAVRQLGIDWEAIAKSLAGFKGAWRRFDDLGKCGQARVIADYAHTPAAIKLIISASRDFFPGRKILFVFQPHQYARTKKLFKEFSAAFDQAEKVLLADIFYVAGREKPEDFEVSSLSLAEAIKARGIEAVYGGDLDELEKKVRDLAGQFDVIIVLGAGDVYDLAKNLVKNN
ncbi:MAG: UDP-N-acetylmuramate--L-alanine ligase [Patescibacteria group bacterium]